VGIPQGQTTFPGIRQGSGGQTLRDRRKMDQRSSRLRSSFRREPDARDGSRFALGSAGFQPSCRRSGSIPGRRRLGCCDGACTACRSAVKHGRSLDASAADRAPGASSPRRAKPAGKPALPVRAGSRLESRRSQYVPVCGPSGCCGDASKRRHGVSGHEFRSHTARSTAWGLASSNQQDTTLRTGRESPIHALRAGRDGAVFRARRYLVNRIRSA